MGCQKKSEQVVEQMKNVALGSISPKHERELLAHVGECEFCREAYDHAEAVRAQVDDSVEALVAAEPSAQFMTRLRAKLASEPAPSRWIWDASTLWGQASSQTLSYVAGAVVLAAILAILVMGLPRRHVSAPSVAEVIPARSATASAAVDSAKSSANLESPRKKVASAPAPSPRTRREPEVLVPKEELLAVAQFYEAIHNTPVDSEQLYAAQQEPQKPLEIKLIEITPLEPLEAPAADSNQGPGL
jgi:hypothetical protein